MFETLVGRSSKGKNGLFAKGGRRSAVTESSFPNPIQSGATDALTQRKPFDPRGTLPEQKPKEVMIESQGKKVLSVMVGAILLVLILNESAAQFGELT